MDVNYYTIDEIAKLSGVSTRTIRYWSHEKILPPPAKLDGRTALYNDKHLVTVELIKHLKENCFLPLAKIKEVVDNPAEINDIKKFFDIKTDVLNVLGHQPPTLSEKGLARKTSLNSTTIKRLEELGFIQPVLTDKGKRFSDDDLNIARLIKKLIKLDFTLDELAFFPEIIEKLADTWFKLGHEKLLSSIDKSSDFIAKIRSINSINREMALLLLQTYLRKSIQDYVAGNAKDNG